MKVPPAPWRALRPTAWPAIGAYAAIYVGLGLLSFSTAYVQTNTAAVWMPTGFSIGLLVTRGPHLWPAVTLGSFALNLATNLWSSALSVWDGTAIAAAVAVGNTGEALLGHFLASRFAGGVSLLSRAGNIVLFAATVATAPPLLSMGVGVTASRLGGLLSSGSLVEIMLTWYAANAVGILILSAPVIALLRHDLRFASGRRVEACCLIACLVFVTQAMSGLYVSPVFQDWPRAYMIIPVLLWAAFRFGTSGALAAILTVTLLSVVGTMRGFEAFPSPSPSRSLIFLQLFLGFLSVTLLSISAALTEVAELQSTLESKVEARTGEVERLLSSRRLLTTLVVHDLQSPLYGVRNALRATGLSIEAGHMGLGEVASTMTLLAETCSTLTSRITDLLAPESPDDSVFGVRPVLLPAILAKIASIHGATTGEGWPVTVRLQRSDLLIQRPAEVERILDGLISNALRYAPRGSAIEICAFEHSGKLEILVTDRGPGIKPEQRVHLFRPEMQLFQRGRVRKNGGLGLYLASEQALELGGRLTYRYLDGVATFCLVLPT